MKKSIFIALLLGVVGFSLFKVFNTISNKIPKVIDTEYVQSKIDQKLEQKNFGEKYKVKYHVNNITVDIKDSLYLKFDMNLEGYGKKGHIIGHISGMPSFNSSKGAFYFVPTSNLEFDKFKLSGKVKQKSLLGKIIMKSKFVKDVVSDDKIIKQAAEKAITFYLKKLPVYKLKDDIKGKVIGATLTKLEVKDGQIKFELSFKKLVWTMFAYITALILSIALIIAIIRSGDGGLLLLGLISLDF